MDFLVGGGGLIAGIATAVKTLSPNTKIIVSRLMSHDIVIKIIF